MTDHKLSLGQKVIYVPGKKGKDRIGRIGALSGTDNTCIIKFSDGKTTPWISQDKVSVVVEVEEEKQPT